MRKGIKIDGTSSRRSSRTKSEKWCKRAVRTELPGGVVNRDSPIEGSSNPADSPKEKEEAKRNTFGRRELRPWPTVSPKRSSSNMETCFFSRRQEEKCRWPAVMGSVS